MMHRLINDFHVQACVLLAFASISSAAMAAEDFGRLFTTPAERASLDNLRRTTRIELVVPDKIEDEKGDTAPVLPPEVSMQGYVKRNDGKKSTVWVNGEPVQENSSTSEVQVGKLQRNGNKVPLKLTGNGKNLNLKAGQVYIPETDSVSEITASTKSSGEESGTIGSNPGEVPAGYR